MITQTIKKLDVATKAMIAEEVTKTIHEIMEDPDFGLELSDYMKRKLKKLSRSRSKTIPFEEIKRKYL